MSLFDNDGFYGANITTKAPFPAGANLNGKQTGSPTGTAATGDINEKMSLGLSEAAPVNVNSGATVNILAAVGTGKLTLTAGKWRISGIVSFTGAGSTIPTGAIIGSISKTTSLPGAGTLGRAVAGEIKIYNHILSQLQNVFHCVVIPTYEIDLSGSQDFYLLATSNGSSGQPQASGYIEAQRI